jgi:hypothetical protein
MQFSLARISAALTFLLAKKSICLSLVEVGARRAPPLLCAPTGLCECGRIRSIFAAADNSERIVAVDIRARDQARRLSDRRARGETNLSNSAANFVTSKAKKTSPLHFPKIKPYL